MVSWSDGEDGDGAECGPRGRVWHVRGRARRGVTGANRVSGCRPVVVTPDQRITVHNGADHAEPRQWLGKHELPEYVGGRLRCGGGGGTQGPNLGNEPAATSRTCCEYGHRTPKCGMIP